MSEPFKMTPEEWLDAEASYGDWFKRHLRNYGSRICAYRMATGKDQFLYTNSDIPDKGGNMTCVPVFILRPRKKVTVTDYVFTATGETRVPCGQEWILFENSGDISFVPPGVYLQDEYPIYTREEITREIEVDE